MGPPLQCKGLHGGGEKNKQFAAKEGDGAGGAKKRAQRPSGVTSHVQQRTPSPHSHSLHFVFHCFLITFWFTTVLLPPIPSFRLVLSAFNESTHNTKKLPEGEEHTHAHTRTHTHTHTHTHTPQVPSSCFSHLPLFSATMFLIPLPQLPPPSDARHDFDERDDDMKPFNPDWM